MMKLALTTAALLIGAGMATAQPQPPQAASPDTTRQSTAPETTGQAATFEDRWSAQRATPERPPTTTDQAPQLKDAQPPPDQGNSSLTSPPVTAPSTQR
jgi:hypothetical protein